LNGSSLCESTLRSNGGSELSNADFLEAIRRLAFGRDGQTLRPVDFKNLGSARVGGIYESLLARTPQISTDGAKVTFAEFSGNDRKTSGSYYTPDSVVEHLLDLALAPVVADAIKGKCGADAESAILKLRVCDPACGSGHFLVGAAHRLAQHLARVRAHSQGKREPSAMTYQHALREVIRRCVYGVDVNPMAVELCKVSLWMESSEPGLALTDFDAHIKCGNSLLGATPGLMEAGISDDAFEPLAGDDKKVMTHYRRRNKREKQSLASGERANLNDVHARCDSRLGLTGTMRAAIAGEHEDDTESVAEHDAQEAASVRSTGDENAKLLADAWCAAFVWRKHDKDAPGFDFGLHGIGDAITEKVYRQIERNPDSVTPWIKDEINRLAGEYRFFHWHVEFPEVFGGQCAADPRTPWPGRGSGDMQGSTPCSIREARGFDVILGNPPFLNQLESDTASHRGVAALMRVRLGGRIRGYTDLSATFLLFSTGLARRGGRIAMVQPQSLLAAKDAAPVRRALLDVASLESLWVSNEHVFDGASVFTCAASLHVGGPRTTALRRTTTGHFAPLPEVTLDNDALAHEDTWSHLNAAASGIPEVEYRSHGTIGDVAMATADFRDQYYGLAGFLVEDAALDPTQRADVGAFPLLVTTGLLDLAQCRWGAMPCRILKARWNAPRIDRRRMEADGTLGSWIASRLVPKLLLATQTRVIEVVADGDARFVPSVPVLTVVPDDPSMVWKLAAALGSPVSSAIAMRKYSGVALSVDAIKLSAKQVLRLPLPPDSTEWEIAARQFRAATEATEARARLTALRAMAKAMVEAFRVPAEQRAPLMEWWWSRLTGECLGGAGAGSC